MTKQREITYNVPSEIDDAGILTMMERGKAINSKEPCKVKREYTSRSVELECSAYANIKPLLPKGITLQDISALMYSVGATLYKQSLEYGNTADNTGMQRIPDPIDPSRPLGTIVVRRKELAQQMYGKKSPRDTEIKKVASILTVLEQASLTATIISGAYAGKEVREKLLHLNKVIKDDETGDEIYVLFVSNLFCGTMKSYTLFPADASFRLTQYFSETGQRRTEQHLWLMSYLSSCGSNQEYQINIDTLIEKLRLGERRNKWSQRVSDKLKSLLDCMVAIGLLKGYKVIKNKNGEPAIKCMPNPNWKDAQMSAKLLPKK